MPDSDEALAHQNRALTRQMLEWIDARSPTYADVIDTWHSSCPRHTIWEDALAAGLVDHDGRRDGTVRLTPEGRRLLAR